MYKFDFKDSISTEILEKPNARGITFYESDMDEVLVPHNDPVLITAHVGEFRISQLLINEGSALSLLYKNY